MSAPAVGVFISNGPAANGWRMPSTAEDVLADTQRAEAAALGERRKRFDLVSFIPRILRADALQPTENEAVMNSATIIQKLWNCCNVLRDDG
jgi:hypothetical protein